MLLKETYKLNKSQDEALVVISSLPSLKEKTVYITFDAGNVSSENVIPLLELLEKENIKATFFLCGKWVLFHPVSARKIA